MWRTIAISPQPSLSLTSHHVKNQYKRKHSFKFFLSGAARGRVNCGEFELRRCKGDLNSVLDTEQTAPLFLTSIVELATRATRKSVCTARLTSSDICVGHQFVETSLKVVLTCGWQTTGAMIIETRQDCNPTHKLGSQDSALSVAKNRTSLAGHCEKLPSFLPFLLCPGFLVFPR